MSYQVRYTSEAKEDIERLYRFLLDQDLPAARRAKPDNSERYGSTTTYTGGAEKR